MYAVARPIIRRENSAAGSINGVICHYTLDVLECGFQVLNAVYFHVINARYRLLGIYLSSTRVCNVGTHT